MGITIIPADLACPALARLVRAHADFCDDTAPPGSCHRLPLTELATPDIEVWAVHETDTLLGMGALKRLSDSAGEIKSMHVTKAARGRGIASQMLAHLTKRARAQGLTSLWLETGTHALFAPARALYEHAGFTACAPFGHYLSDPHSVFMTRDLLAKETTP